MKRALFISGIVAAALSVTAVSVAAKGMGRNGPMMPSFQELDADQDGKITPSEIEAFSKLRFETADTNSDGFLSADELEAQTLKRMQERAKMRSAKMLEKKDANGDGKLSLEEMKQNGKRQAKMFKHMDADNDGAISAQEYQDAKANMKQRHKGKHKGMKMDGAPEASGQN